MDGWMDSSWGVTAMGKASSLPPSQPFRNRHWGSSWSSSSHRPSVKASSKTAQAHRPHHDPRPLSEEILSAQGRGMFSKTVVVPRRCTVAVKHRNTPTWPSESPDPQVPSFIFTLTWVKATALLVALANTHSDRIPSVSAGRNGPSRKSFLLGRGNGL